MERYYWNVVMVELVTSMPIEPTGISSKRNKTDYDT